MRSKLQLLNLLAIVIALMVTGCNSSSNRQYKTLTIEGGAMASNISNSSPEIIYFSKSDEKLEFKLPVSPGDLLSIYSDDENGFFYRYGESDEDNFRITYGEDQDNAIYLNETPVTFQLTENDSSWFQFNASDPTVIDRLSYIHLDFQVSDQQISYLDQFSSYYRDIGLLLDCADQPELLNRLLPILQPKWLFVVCDSSLNIDEDAASILANLELLNIIGDMPGLTNLLMHCHNLEHLIISEWNQAESESLPLSNLKHLTSITMTNCNFTDLSNIEFPESLTRLHLPDCGSFTDISLLGNIKKLRSLSLSGCQDIVDITSINDLPDLQFFSPPTNITQDEFNQIMQDQQSLAIIELYGCDSIHDLALLKHQLNLKTLILNIPDIDLMQLSDLDNLELIILESDYFDNHSEAIEELQNALPDTEIYPGGGLCLGSGWLILMLPFLFIMRYIRYLNRKKK